jgi:hypothetical protein
VGKADQVAGELAEAFFRAAPTGRKKWTSEAEWANSLRRFFADAEEIRLRYRLGIIGRARAAHRLQQRLIGAGLPAEVVRKVVFALIMNSFASRA